ncbi:MAG: TonB family protein [Verrucomicrobiota bacterium]
MKPSMPARLFEILTPALITAAIFIGLPLFDLRHDVADRSALYELDVAEPPPPPAPPPPLREIREEVRLDAPKPRLANPKPLMPVQASLRLDMNIQPTLGDVELSFSTHEPGIEIRPEDFVFEIDDLDTPPLSVSRVRPIYPPRARSRKIEGKVSLEFVVAEDGSVRDLRITLAEPPEVFDDAALKAVKRWQFNPGVKNGRPVPTRVRQTLTFALE